MKNKKGFFTIEMLVTSTIIASFLIIIYYQVYSILNQYEKRSNYNTIDGLYAANNVRNFLRQNELSILKGIVEANKYVDLTDCSFISNNSYCNTLFNNLDIKQAILTNYNITNLKDFNYLNDFDPLMKAFINSITIIESSEYRIIVYLNDGSISTIKVR
ncbi:MAG: hypothetical protein ACK5HL_00960 [Bacilli bacterium]